MGAGAGVGIGECLRGARPGHPGLTGHRRPRRRGQIGAAHERVIPARRGGCEGDAGGAAVGETRNDQAIAGIGRRHIHRIFLPGGNAVAGVVCLGHAVMVEPPVRGALPLTIERDRARVMIRAIKTDPADIFTPGVTREFTARRIDGNTAISVAGKVNPTDILAPGITGQIARRANGHTAEAVGGKANPPDVFAPRKARQIAAGAIEVNGELIVRIRPGVQPADIFAVGMFLCGIHSRGARSVNRGEVQQQHDEDGLLHVEKLAIPFWESISNHDD